MGEEIELNRPDPGESPDDGEKHGSILYFPSQYMELSTRIRVNNFWEIAVCIAIVIVCAFGLTTSSGQAQSFFSLHPHI